MEQTHPNAPECSFWKFRNEVFKGQGDSRARQRRRCERRYNTNEL
jgi:hypothetical protein